MTEQNFEQMRHAMVVSQLRTTGVSDARVVVAMGGVPREAFVPAERASLAYLDIAVPLAAGRALTPPMVTGRLLTEAQIAPGDTVLLIGGATGYTAAVLAKLGAKVTAVEADAALAAQGRDATAGAAVEWIDGPLAAGHATGAPYGLVFIDGAVEEIPAAIVDQIVDGGRLVGALVQDGIVRLVSGVRVGKGFGVKAFADADAPRLPGFAKPASFSF